MIQQFEGLGSLFLSKYIVKSNVEIAKEQALEEELLTEAVKGNCAASERY
ncbi:hypothetical protein [Brevibacillus parabrevis]|nr:hypothetical protein [Brevibacillus parabrevis]WDV94189.1 hypothetical protein PSE45_21505 [Brevibacillus parabrevis]